MKFFDGRNEELAQRVEKRLSPKRFSHTLAVCEAALRLASYCLPNSRSELESAALLHDIAKELPIEELISLINNSDRKTDAEDLLSVGPLHSFAGPEVIKRDFPEFATENILSAVYNHTIGAPDMSVFDEIIFLADFIEDTRSYAPAVETREYAYSSMKEGLFEHNLSVLHAASVKEIDSTLIHLIENKKIINSKNILTRNALLSKI